MCDEVPAPKEAQAHLAGIRLHVGDELLHVAGRHGGAHRQHQRPAAAHRDGGEVLEQVVGHLREGVRVLRHGRGGRIEQGVAVRQRARHLACGQHGAGAGLVVDDHAGAQHLAELLRHDARLRIGAAAGREAHHDADRLAAAHRKVLRQRQGRHAQEGRRAERRAECAAGAAGFLHRCLRLECSSYIGLENHKNPYRLGNTPKKCLFQVFCV